MWTIVPDTQENYDELKPKRLSYTYLHGQLESDCGYDCYGISNCDLPLKKDSDTMIDHTLLKDGEYPCVYNNKPCTLYFWHCSINHPHGLVVYNDDLDSVEYAKSKLLEKPVSI
jgi:hypothetical protein